MSVVKPTLSGSALGRVGPSITRLAALVCLACIFARWA
jgi:hypothetical protein